MTRSVARYFRMDPVKVPFFVQHKDWEKRLRAFFRRRGYELEWRHYWKRLLSNKRKLYIVQGLSPRSTPQRKFDHAVLYRGTKPYFDPSADGLFLKGRPKYVWLVTKRK